MGLDSRPIAVIQDGMHEALIADYWPEVVSALAAPLDLNQTAHDRGAFRQARGVPDAASLLRLANAADWLGDIANAMLRTRAAAPERRKGFRLRLGDATSICHPGADRTSWRLHVGYDLEAGRIDTVELTDVKGTESFDRFRFQQGDIALADAGYPKPGDLRPVIEDGAHLVVRIGWCGCCRRRTALPSTCSPPCGACPATMADFSSGSMILGPIFPPLLLRMVVWRQDEQSRETARRKVRKPARKVGKTPDARTLEAADDVLLLTSLPTAHFTAGEVRGLDRFRWHIELAFKRWKSILHLGNLPAKSPRLARAWIYAMLIEDQTVEVLDSPPVRAASNRSSPSVWRIVKILWTDVKMVILGTRPWRGVIPHAARLVRNLIEPRRRRTKQCNNMPACLMRDVSSWRIWVKG